jgi:hypothetical protein
MIRTILLSILSLLLTSLSYGQSIITLPENPIIESIPQRWKGHNHGGFSVFSHAQTPGFINAFSKMNPGVIRWPAGNKANDYRWMDHLEDTDKLNLKNVIPFLNSFEVELQIVVNFGNGSAAEAAEFVKICNSEENTYINIRSNLLNTSQPINVKSWEIGNENGHSWAYEWSWFGFQDNIHFQTGIADKPFTKDEADNLYYYGGEFYREGWVDAIGSQDFKTAILGNTKFYTTASSTDGILVNFPFMDITDVDAVRVYRTPNFDNVWAQTASQQDLYDAISNPINLLLPSEVSWTKTEVTITPSNGLNIDDFVLIEYNSIGHDGAFAFRNAMKAADPTIEIGYNVKLGDIKVNDPVFQQDFAASPPDFMIKHPYVTGLSIPAIQAGLFSEAAYVSEFNITQTLNNFQEKWNEREVAWGIPSEIGLSLTEWNVALFASAPSNHPIRGIFSGLYVADYWARLFENGLNDSLDLRDVNHFALSATGNNFIHLLHTNPTFSVGVQGKATIMVMEAISEGMFPVTFLNNPQIDITVPDEQGMDSTITIDAIPTWGGIGVNSEYVNLLLINRDDENSHTVDIEIPASWQADNVLFESLHGTIINENFSTNYNDSPFTGSTYTAVLPAFSVNTVRVHITNPLGLDEHGTGLSDTYIYPNPSSDFLYINSKQTPISIEIFNVLGQKVNNQTAIAFNKIDISKLKNGIYFIRLIYFDKKEATYKFIKKQ